MSHCVGLPGAKIICVTTEHYYGLLALQCILLLYAPFSPPPRIEHKDACILVKFSTSVLHSQPLVTLFWFLDGFFHPFLIWFFRCGFSETGSLGAHVGLEPIFTS